MKKYIVKLLTQKGIVSIPIKEGDDLPAIEEALKIEYGDFVTLSTTEVK